MPDDALVDTSVAWILAGIACTFLATVLTVRRIGKRHKRFSLTAHVLMVGAYLPLVIIVLALLEPRFKGTSPGRVLTLGLASVTFPCAHALMASWRRLRDLRSEGSGRATSELGLKRIPPARSVMARVLVNCSVAEYRDAILDAESEASDFAFVQRRIAPYLNSDEMLRFVAAQRFGEGHPETHAYVATHQRRRQAFLAALDSGARYREILPRNSIMRYVETGTHSDDMWPLPVAAVVELLQNWRQAILAHPNYYVAISDYALPLKYHVVDGECVVLHEPVGKTEHLRFNSIFIYSKEAAAAVAKDFDVVWGLIDPQWRDSTRVANWIKDELVALARCRKVK